jgi:DNA polymerase-3 subunit beta
VGTLSDRQVDMSLTVRTQTLNVRCGASNTDLKCIDAQEFPPMPVSDLSQGLQIKVSELKEMIQQVVFAASTDDARPILTGVLVTVRGNKIILAAADGFRLSVRKAELASPAAQAISAVIPARALSELARIAGDGDQMVTMVMPRGRNQVVFRTRDVELVSQLIDGSFPDYEQIIPGSFKTRAVLSTSAFLKACRQAEIFAREGSHIATLDIRPVSELQPGAVEISGQSEETGSNQNIVEANIEGNPLQIAFNVRFLREVLDVIKTPNVALETGTARTPGTIRPVGAQASDGEFLHVIMPMQLGS